MALPLSAFRQMVVTRCQEYGPTDNHFVLPGSPPLFVKYGDPNLRSEARTQQYLYDMAQNDPHAPYVPKVIDAFSDNGDDADEEDHDSQGSAYIVMEYVDAPTLGSWIDAASSTPEHEQRVSWAAVQVAKAVSWIHACPVPHGQGIGPKSGGIPQHDWFADRVAPMPFANTEALEAYINKALSRAPPKGRRVISLSGERLLLCHSDITVENALLLDIQTGRLCLIDAQHVQFFPVSFASYALHASAGGFVARVAQHINLPRSKHLSALAQAAGLIQQSGDKTLGLMTTARKAKAKAANLAAEAAWGKRPQANGWGQLTSPWTSVGSTW